MVSLPPHTVVFFSPLRSVSRNGPNPTKKWGTGWNISGTNRFSVKLLSLVVVPVVVDAPDGTARVVLVLEYENPILGQTEIKSESPMS